MNILTFNQLQNLKKTDVPETKKKIVSFLKQRKDIIFAAFYGSSIGQEYNKLSDIDVFIIYSDFRLIEKLRSLYKEKHFGDVEVEWKLVPDISIMRGVPLEENYFETITFHHEYISGHRAYLNELKYNSDTVSQFLLSKYMKEVDYYIKDIFDTKQLSKMLRAIYHVPRKILNYTGNSKKELFSKYYNQIKIHNFFAKNYLELAGLLRMYKMQIDFVKNEEQYQRLLDVIHEHRKQYILWLHSNISYHLNHKKTLQV